MDYDDFPDQDDYFHGLEEEMHSDYQDKLEPCESCGHLCHVDNLIDGRCENCWDDSMDDDFEDDDIKD